LQQSFVVEFIVGPQQCEACERSHTDKTWKAIVQVRQHVGHKRTMFYLEQLILKHNMHENCINIKERPDGIDFYYNHKSHAQKLVHFLGNYSPIKVKTSERLITHDPQSNIFNFKYSFSVEMAPICREDAICLSKSYSKSLGGLGPVVVCYKFNCNIYLMEPYSLRTFEMAGPLFWKAPYKAMLTSKHLVEFTIIDVEPVKPRVEVGKWLLVEAQVVKSDDPDNVVMYTKSHMGHLLKPGDTVLGYDLKNTNANEANIEEYNNNMANIPDVILIRKVYTKANKERNWQLKHLAKKEQENMKKNDIAKREQDMNRFMEELEEDPEMRSNVKIFKATTPAAATAEAAPAAATKAPAPKKTLKTIAAAAAKKKVATKKPASSKKAAEEDDDDVEEEADKKPAKKSFKATKKVAKEDAEEDNEDEWEDDDDEEGGEWEDVEDDENAPGIDDAELLDDNEENAPKVQSDKHTGDMSDEDIFEEDDFEDAPAKAPAKAPASKGAAASKKSSGKQSAAESKGDSKRKSKK